MSSAFVTIGVLVIAAFALGLVVGGLAWRSAASPPEEPESAADGREDRDETESQSQSRSEAAAGPESETPALPEWQVEQVDDVDRSAIDLGSASSDPVDGADPTVVIGPRTFGWKGRTG